MRKVIRVVIAALFLQFLVGGASAEAVTPRLTIQELSVDGNAVRLWWVAPKNTFKNFYMVKITEVDNPKNVVLVGTAGLNRYLVLKNFKKYYAQLFLKGKELSTISAKKYFQTNSPSISGVTIKSISYTNAELVWAPISGATGYEIVLDETVTKTVASNSAVLSGLDAATNYKVNIRAISGNLKGKEADPTDLSTNGSGPEKISASQITKNGFTLNWSSVVGADSYNVYRGTLLVGNTKATSYLVSALNPGSSATYSVTAVFGKSETLDSPDVSVTTLLETPSKPIVSTVTSQGATISWTSNPNVLSYEVNIYDALGTTLVKSTKVAGSLSSAVISGLGNSTSYTVGIKHTYSESVSKESDLSTFTTLKASVGTVAVTASTTTSLTISWSPLVSASSYEVYRDGVAFATGISISNTNWVITSLAPGQTYKLSVRAYYVDGQKSGAYTEFVDVSGTTLTDPIYRPTIYTLPVISLPYANAPIVGATISVNNGAWTSVPAVTSYSYQWQRSVDGGSTWNDLNGATTSSYVVTISDATYILRVRVSATNVNGTGITYTSDSSPVATVYNIQAPIVRGNAVLGQILEVSDGNWSSPYAITLSYKWYRNGSLIDSATSPSYTITSSDVGYMISARVIASTTYGYSYVTSPTRGLITPVGNTVAPSITGTLRVGGTLSVSTGTWLNLENDSTVSYQWQSSVDGILWNNIAGATSSTCVIQQAQAGNYIRAQVFQAKTGYASAVVANSGSTTAVPALNVANTVAPSVSGAWSSGTTLIASTGTWTSNGTFTYQWQSSSDNSTWSDIASATGSSYVLTSSENSKYVRVQVTNTTSSSSGIAYSVSRSKIGTPFNTALPTISGTIRVGSTQTVTTGTWANTPTAYSYQWQKSTDGFVWENVAGQTSATYSPTFSVANHQIRVSVSAGNGVDTATVTSAVVSGFLPPQATAIPTLTSTARVGYAIDFTSVGVWPGSSDSYLVYQWQRSSDDGVTWSNIATGTADRYVPSVVDIGYKIRAQVSLTTNTGTSTAYSLPTVAVVPAS